jgi:pyrimidine operon attenuation protein/uracil phosphoribosyltransferase
VDRGGHELPIAADFVGARLEVAAGQDVQVRLREDGQGDDVVLITGRAP